MSGDVLYLDASALIKLAVHEPESTGLWRFLRGRPRRATCALAQVEVLRAVRRGAPSALPKARGVLDDIEMIPIDDALLEAAAELDAPDLRSLDAIHLAAAFALGRDLAAVVTYDGRMAAAARALRLEVDAPR